MAPAFCRSSPDLVSKSNQQMLSESKVRGAWQAFPGMEGKAQALGEGLGKLRGS